MVATKTRTIIEPEKLNTLEVMYAPKEGGIGDKILILCTGIESESKIPIVHLLTAMHHIFWKHSERQMQ